MTPLAEAEADNPAAVKVVAGLDGHALYFSRSLIPYPRHPGPQNCLFKHIGVYAYRREFLLKFAALPQTPLEKTESLEQLRALEHGYRIRMIETPFQSIGVGYAGGSGTGQTILSVGRKRRMTKAVKTGKITLGGGAPLTLIAGPCVIEGRDRSLYIGRSVCEIAQRLGIPYIFKASFDKANRSSFASFRGPGLEAGLAILAEIKAELGVPVLSDIHEASQAEPAARVLDILQIPAFLCRQTDLLHAAALTGKPVNVKKGQFLSPQEMKNVADKLEESGNSQILLTERGSSFGYNNLVVDMRSLAILRSLGYPVVFDATHSVQLPGGSGDCSGGQSEFAPVLARAAAAVGIDALFLEVHDNPAEALSDGPNMIPLAELEVLLRQVLAVDRTVRGMI